MKKSVFPVIMAIALFICLSAFLPFNAANQGNEKSNGFYSAQEELVYSAVDETVTTPQMTYIYQIPAFSFASEDAERLNSQMFNALKPYVDRALNELKESVTLIDSIKYDVYQNGDIISVVACLMPDYPSPEYFVMNLNSATGKEATRADLLAIKELTEESFYEAEKNAAHEFFDELWAQYTEEEYIDCHGDEQLAKTLADENFKANSNIFFNSSGELCIVLPIYQAAGADSTNRIIVVAP